MTPSIYNNLMHYWTFFLLKKYFYWSTFAVYIFLICGDLPSNTNIGIKFNYYICKIILIVLFIWFVIIVYYPNYTNVFFYAFPSLFNIKLESIIMYFFEQPFKFVLVIGLKNW